MVSWLERPAEADVALALDLDGEAMEESSSSESTTTSGTAAMRPLVDRFAGAEAPRSGPTLAWQDE